MSGKDIEEKYGDTAVADGANSDVDLGDVSDNADHLQRRLNNRQIQLIAIGGSIGTALFVSIGGGLNKGGPGSLLLAYLAVSRSQICIRGASFPPDDDLLPWCYLKFYFVTYSCLDAC